jgi:hypothetical protein
LAVRGEGPWRLEDKDGVPDAVSTDGKILFLKSYGNQYLSRIQRYTRWHFAIQWPLCFLGHFYFKKEYVQSVTAAHEDKDGKVFSFYRGWHFDGDEIYWGDGGGAGNFK